MRVLKASDRGNTAPAIADTFGDLLLFAGSADIMPHHSHHPSHRRPAHTTAPAISRDTARR